MTTTYVQKAGKDTRLLSIEECILFMMLKKVSGKTPWGRACKNVIESKDNSRFRELYKQMSEQIRDGEDCRKTMESIIGIHAVNKILSLTR